MAARPAPRRRGPDSESLVPAAVAARGGGATGGGAVAGGTGDGRCVWRHQKTPAAATSNTTIPMKAPRLMP